MSLRTEETRRNQGYQSVITGQRGELLVRDLFSGWGWLPRDISGDYDQGLDLFVEVGHCGSGQGFHFLVSVKASDGKSHVSEQGVGHDIRKHNVAYLQRQDRVVFLLFAKLQHRLVYWVDLKHALTTGRQNRSGGVRILVPAENLLHPDADAATLVKEREAFLQAIERANTSWHIPRFNELPTTIAEKERALARLDPRCDVKIFAGSAGTRYEVRVREPIEIQGSMRMASRGDAEKLSESIRFGTANSISVESFELTGSRVIEKLHSPDVRGTVTLSTEPAFAAAFLLGPAHHQGKDKPIFLRFSGQFTRGAHGAQGTVRSPDNPLGIRLRVDGAIYRISFNFETNLDRWAGRSILPMSGLLRAADALGQMADAGDIELRLLPEVPDPIFQREITPDNASNFRLTADYLRALDDLREVALPYVHDVIIGADTEWSMEDVHWWQIGRRLLQGERIEIPAGNLCFRYRKGEAAAWAAVEDWTSSIVLAPVPLEISAFGTDICQIPVDLYARDYAAELVDGADDEVEVRLTRQPRSSLMARRASSESIEDFVREARAGLVEQRGGAE